MTPKADRPAPLLPALLALAMLGFHALAARQDDPPRPALVRIAHVEDPASVGVGRLLPDLTLTALDGRTTRLSQLLADRKLVVLAATSATCPLSDRYADRLVALGKELESRGGVLALVNATDTDTPDDMRQHVRDIRMSGLYLPDADRALRAALGIRTTTETFVIDTGRTLAYRGAVDDQFGVGTALPAPRHAWLRDAIDAVLDARAPVVRATWSPGCLVDAPAPDHAPAAGADLTYHNRISRILLDRCVECHRRGGSGPFPLDTYQAVAGRAAMLDAVVRDGLMPPWHAAPPPEGEPSPFVNDRSLPAEERRDLLAWLNSNRPTGSPADAPAPRSFPMGWTIGTPDLLVMSGPLTIPAGGGLRHNLVIIDTRLEEPRWVSAVEVRSMAHGMLHHALVYVLPEGSTAIDGPPDPAAGLLAISGMAFETTRFPDNAAVRLPPGARLLVHLYSQPADRPRVDRVRIALRFAASPPRHEVLTLAAGAPDLVVPAGAASFTASAERTLDRPTTISAFMPALRARARAIRYDAMLPDGDVRTLLDVPAYDYKWRLRYALREPVELPGGTRVRCTAVFDNSAANPNNPDPSRPAAAGWAADDEMLLGFFETLTAPAP